MEAAKDLPGNGSLGNPRLVCEGRGLKPKEGPSKFIKYVCCGRTRGGFLLAKDVMLSYWPLDSTATFGTQPSSWTVCLKRKTVGKFFFPFFLLNLFELVSYRLKKRLWKNYVLVYWFFLLKEKITSCRI